MMLASQYEPVSPARLRILHVVPTYYPAVRYGGPIRSVHGLAVALVKRGHDVHVYTTSVDGDRDLEVPERRAVDLNGVSVHYFRVPAIRRLYWAPAMRKELRRSVAEFDVVHIHSVFLWPTWAAARAAAAAEVPYIVSPRGMLMRDVIRRKSRWVKSAWINLIEHRTLAQASAIHVTADLEGAELTALDLSMQRLVHVPNGIDPPPDRKREDDLFTNLPVSYALFLSRISWKKGLDRLITAWQDVPELDLVIAGNDDENYRPRLEALASTLGVSGRVHFLGPVKDEDKWVLYQKAEMFLLPSYSENFGNVVAEAMLQGCPVIVSPEVGIASLVQEAAAGLVVSNRPDQLSAAVRDLHADPSRRTRLGENGRRAALEKLSWQAIAHQMEAVYRRVSESRRPLALPADNA